MQIGMIGLGRMGSNMVRRLINAGHECVVYARTPATVAKVAAYGATGVASIEELVERLTPPRALWLMVPAGAVDETVAQILPHFSANDILIDGGNSYYVDDIRRAKEVAESGVKWIDVGTSGGVFGLERGYCLMIGGDEASVKTLDPIFKSLAPGRGSVDRTPGRERLPASTAEDGYLHCGPSGAGHFVKMVHNGIEYGIMGAYAEGLNILKHANAGKTVDSTDAETTPMRNPELYQYDFALPEIAEVWRRGSVVSSWLLDLTATALAASPELTEFGGRVSDSGEGRWTSIAAIDEGVPADILTTALYARFTSREGSVFADKLLSAMRFQFGGHEEKKA
ncbi:phosphogluconate dehydrogenase (NAD(+)-dependent, decarboxylating) [Terriglobus roseus]|uniref:6-phosphogluconate dehydrogenase (Decarboxylating) n=1 Tax=Terriglobus roseus TaxID=392734 RepID=A0A1G7KDJ6_9BACT|nr:decarboxylating 6-phosphogluconate dehydrogenase [Terriglobus roseus]SDF35226.1 6-phosphogluconate dehydrogenase (decarboxylating) [Terriglobus roseus]